MRRHIYTASILGLIDLLTGAYIAGREWVGRVR